MKRTTNAKPEEVFLRELPKPHPGAKRAVLCFPGEYSLGMSSLGFQTVFWELSCRAGLSCQRAFVSRGKQRGRSWETGRLLSSFDLVAFSLSYELDYVAALAMMQGAGIPLRHEERKEGHPLMVAGGIAVSANPLPLSDFFDAVFLGESEESLGEFIALFLRQDLGRPPLAAGKIEGVLIPSARQGETRVERRVYAGFPQSPACSWVLSDEAHFGEMHLVEIGRGCRQRCSFCLLSSVSGRPRAAETAAVLKNAEAGRKRRRQVGLIGSTALKERQLAEVMESLLGLGFGLSLDSLRLDLLSGDVISLLKQGGVRSLAVAPEAGSEVLRKKMGKQLSDDAIEEKVAALAEAGIRRIKLYFLLGLPGGEDDAEAIAALVRRLAGAAGRSLLTLVLNPFIPKAATAWERTEVPPLATWRRQADLVRKSLKRTPRVRVKAKATREQLHQLVLARGGREVGEALQRTAQQGEPFDRALAAVGLSADDYLRRLKGDLPWSFIS